MVRNVAVRKTDLLGYGLPTPSLPSPPGSGRRSAAHEHVFLPTATAACVHSSDAVFCALAELGRAALVCRLPRVVRACTLSLSQVGADGRAYTRLFYPSLQEIWPDLYRTPHIRLVQGCAARRGGGVAWRGSALPPIHFFSEPV